jgi:hypothetical protein
VNKVLKSIFLKVVLVFIVVILIIKYVFFGFDFIDEPNPKKIEVIQGNEYVFDIKIKRDNTYKVGIKFHDEGGGNNKIAAVFGKGILNATLPASMGIIIQDINGKEVFSNENFGGDGPLVTYGPNPILFNIGFLYFKSGDYKVFINIKDAYQDFSNFNSYFFIKFPYGQMNFKI